MRSEYLHVFTPFQEEEEEEEEEKKEEEDGRKMKL